MSLFLLFTEQPIKVFRTNTKWISHRNLLRAWIKREFELISHELAGYRKAAHPQKTTTIRPASLLDRKRRSNRLWSSASNRLICQIKCASNAQTPKRAANKDVPWVLNTSGKIVKTPKSAIKSQSHCTVLAPKRRAVDFTPISASSSLSWWA